MFWKIFFWFVRFIADCFLALISAGFLEASFIVFLRLRRKIYHRYSIKLRPKNVTSKKDRKLSIIFFMFHEKYQVDIKYSWKHNFWDTYILWLKFSFFHHTKTISFLEGICCLSNYFPGISDSILMISLFSLKGSLWRRVGVWSFVFLHWNWLNIGFEADLARQIVSFKVILGN